MKVNIHADSIGSRNAGEIETDELLHNLGRFPNKVLPNGVLRELQSRGVSIHDSLVRLLSEAIESKQDGRQSESGEVFFAFALLVPIATSKDRSLISSLLSLPDRSVNDLIGDLCDEALSHAMANLFKEGDTSESTEWLVRLWDNTHCDSFSIYRALTVAVTKGFLDRTTAIDILVSQLKKRADKRYDTQSAMIVYELIDLSARNLEAVDAVVRSSFASNQVDSDYIQIESWDNIDRQSIQRSTEVTWNDPAAELSRWNYVFASDDLDALNANLRVNEANPPQHPFDKLALLAWIDQLRKSNDQNFPRDAVQSLNREYAYAYQAMVGLLREEIDRYAVQRDTDSWIGNGAYMAWVLLLARKMPVPTDLLQTVLRMPVIDRERILGDQFDLIVHSVALIPWKQMDFVDQWIWDTDRSEPDRRDMVDVYLFAAHHNLIERKTAIDTLAKGLQRALKEEACLVAPYATNLAFLSPKEHSQLLEIAFERDDEVWFYSLDDLQRISKDEEFAKKMLWERLIRYRDVNEIISAGVMFDSVLLDRKPHRIAPVNRVDPAEPTTPVVKIIRKEARTSRNDQCPCGSGKKFKKCCLYKPVT